MDIKDVDECIIEVSTFVTDNVISCPDNPSFLAAL
jgi:hypothetical protein